MTILPDDHFCQPEIGKLNPAVPSGSRPHEILNELEVEALPEGSASPCPDGECEDIKTGEFPWGKLCEFDLQLACIAADTAAACALPTDVVAPLLVGTISHAIGPASHVLYRECRYRTNIYTFLGLPSGSGKNKILKLLFGPFYEWADREANAFNVRRVNNRVELDRIARILRKDSENDVQLLRKKNRLNEEIGRDPAYFVSAATSPAIRMYLNANGGVLSSIVDETKTVSKLLRGMAYSKGEDDSIYLSCYEPSHVHDARKTDGESYRNEPLINAMMMCTWAGVPHQIRDLISDPQAEFIHGGLLPRFMLILTEHLSARDHTNAKRAVDSGIYESYSKRYTRIIENFRGRFQREKILYELDRKYGESGTPPEEGLINIPEGLCQRIAAYANEFTVDDHRGKWRGMEEFSARREAAVIRKTGVLHIWRHVEKAHDVGVEPCTIDFAIAIDRWEAEQWWLLLRERVSGAVEDDIRKWQDRIHREGGEVTMTQLKNKFGENRQWAQGLVDRYPEEFALVERSGKTKSTHVLVSRKPYIAMESHA